MKTGVEFIACAAAGRTAQEMATIHPRLAADLSSTPKQVERSFGKVPEPACTPGISHGVMSEERLPCPSQDMICEPELVKLLRGQPVRKVLIAVSRFGQEDFSPFSGPSYGHADFENSSGSEGQEGNNNDYGFELRNPMS
eukprot:s3307_g6.t1